MTWEEIEKLQELTEKLEREPDAATSTTGVLLKRITILLSKGVITKFYKGTVTNPDAKLVEEKG